MDAFVSDDSVPQAAPVAGRRRGLDRLSLVLAGLALALGVVAHANALYARFVWDDVHEVRDNTSIEDLGQPLAILRHSPTRPIVNLSYAIDYRIWGGRNEFGFHLTNLLLHLANVALLFGFTWLVVSDAGRARGRPGTGAARMTAFVAAALFAVHPMMTETVAYISSRSEMLCGAFMLASLHWFRRAFAARSRAAERSDGGPRGEHREAHLRGAPSTIGGLACFALALGSKETAAMLPFVLLAYDRWLRPESPEMKRARLWRLHVPLLSLVAIAGAIRMWLFVAVEHPAAVAPAPESAVLTNLYVFVRYLSLLLLPIRQTIVPVVAPIRSLLDSRALAALVALGAVVALALRARKTAPLVTFGLAWFFLLLLPSSALTVISQYGQRMAEHRAYVASLGFFMAVASIVTYVAGLGELEARRARLLVTAAALSAVVVGLATLTISRNRLWADPIALWTDAVQKAPGTWAAVHGLADAEHQTGDCRAAIEEYQRAIALLPQAAESYAGMADCFLELKRVPSAAETLRLGLSRAPDDTRLQLQLAVLEEQYFRDPAEALRLCQSALARSPGLRFAQDCVRRNQQVLSNGR